MSVIAPSESKAPSAAEMDEMFGRIIAQLKVEKFVLDATIDDYPIGRSERGKCRLQVERAKGKGYRLVRTTTGKNGVWCKPKKSVYHNAYDGPTAIAVMLDPTDAQRHAWITVSYRGVYLTAANYECTGLLECWRHGPPSRMDRTYTITSQIHELNANVELVKVGDAKRESTTFLADSQDEISAWDHWADRINEVRKLILTAWETAKV